MFVYIAKLAHFITQGIAYLRLRLMCLRSCTKYAGKVVFLVCICLNVAFDRCKKKKVRFDFASAFEVQVMKQKSTSIKSRSDR